MKFFSFLFSLMLCLSATANTLVNEKTGETIEATCIKHDDQDNKEKCITYSVTPEINGPGRTVLFYSAGTIHQFDQYSKYKTRVLKHSETFVVKLYEFSDSPLFTLLIGIPVGVAAGLAVDVVRLPYSLTKNAINSIKNNQRDHAIKFLFKLKDKEKVISNKMFKELLLFMKLQGDELNHIKRLPRS